jgi:tripeptide aminopeptidase
MSDRAINDLLALLTIPGPPADERQVAEHLQGVLEEIGVPSRCITTDAAHTRSEYGGSTGNLIVQLDGHGRGPRRLFSAHMDTVPLAVGAVPRLDADGARIINNTPGKALGGDNRTGCAVLLQVARELCERNGDHPPTTLVFFIQEEVGLVGARGLDVALLGAPKPAMGFNFDGSRVDQFVTSVIGTERFTIDVEGIAAHAGAHPEEGVSAAIIAADALAELARDGWHGAIEKPSGRGSANVGIINGGTGSNVVMPVLHILAEARSHQAEFQKTIIERWQESFRRAAATQRNRSGASGSVRFGPGPKYEAFELPAEAPVVRTALAAAARCGVAARCVSNDGGMDANQLVAHGIPTVTTGAGQRHVHTSDEYVDIPDFLAACRLAVELTRSDIQETR